MDGSEPWLVEPRIQIHIPLPCRAGATALAAAGPCAPAADGRAATSATARAAAQRRRRLRTDPYADLPATGISRLRGELTGSRRRGASARAGPIRPRAVTD